MSKNRKHHVQSAFLTNAEVQELGLSLREVRRADGAHADMLLSLSQRVKHGKVARYRSAGVPENSAATRQVQAVEQFVADWKRSKGK